MVLSVRVAKICALLVTTVSAVVFIGWISGLAVLTSIIPSEIPMAMSTGACFLLFALGLWSQTRPQHLVSQNITTVISSTLVILIAGCILVFRLLGIPTDWEHPFIRINNSGNPFDSGHMSLVTASLLVCLGFAQIFLRSKSASAAKTSSLLTIFTFIASFLIFLGYCLKAPFFYTGKIIPPSSLGALSFLIATSGLIAASDKRNYLIARLTHTTTSGRLLTVLLPVSIAGTILESIIIVQILPLIPINPAIGISILTVIFIIALSFAIPAITNIIGKSLDHALDSLKISEEKFRNLFENSPIGKSMTLLDGTVRVNKSFCNIIGYSEEEMRHLKWMDITHPGDIASTFEAMQSLKSGAASNVRFDKRYLHKNGSVVWTDLSSYLQRDEKGEPEFFITSITDITQNKLKEELLKESESKYRRLIENSPDIVYVFSALRGGIYYSPSVEKILGYTEEYLLKHPFLWNESIHPEDLGSVTGAIESIQNSRPFSMEYRIKDAAGNWLWFYDRSIGKFDHGEEILIEGLVSDVTKRKETEQEILRAKELAEMSELQHRSILRTAMDGFCTTDFRGNIVEVNEAYCRMVGYTETELLALSIADLVVGEKPEDIIERNSRIREFGADRFETVHRRKDGGLINVEVSVQFKLKEGDLLVAFLRDITQRKKSEYDLNQAKERAVESDKLKTALLNNLSHEIRTPMNAIMGFSSLLPEAEAGDVKPYSDIILKSAEDLLRLLDDVILVSRLQSEKIPVASLPCSPAGIVDDLFRVGRISNQNEFLNITAQVPDKYRGLIIQSDEDKIRQVLHNFVSNAIKYTKEGSVEIGLDAGKDTVEFYVADTGIGIPVKEQQKIFDTFFRGDAAIRDAIRGNGLGLNICKELVELMGGTIGFLSEPGKGSRFSFTLPLKMSGSSGLIPKPESASLSRASGKVVLIVDDELLNFVYLEMLLKGKAERADHAINGALAIEMASQNRYDLVLMDMKMPVMDGYEATRILKQKYPDLKVIALTAFTLPEDRDRAMSAGCDDFFSKPVTRESFVEMMNKYL